MTSELAEGHGTSGAAAVDILVAAAAAVSVASAEPSVVVVAVVAAAELLTSAVVAAAEVASVAVEEVYDSHNTILKQKWPMWGCVAGHSYSHTPPAQFVAVGVHYIAAVAVVEVVVGIAQVAGGYIPDQAENAAAVVAGYSSAAATVSGT